MISRCAWCQKTLSEDNEIDQTGGMSHGIYLSCSVMNDFVVSEDLSDLPKEFLNKLPNGVIVIDNENKIISFNFYEKKDRDTKKKMF